VNFSGSALLGDLSGALVNRFIIFNARGSVSGNENPHLFLSLLLASGRAERTRQVQRRRQYFGE